MPGIGGGILPVHQNNINNGSNNSFGGAADPFLNDDGGSHQQVLLSVDFDGDTVKLLPAEVATMLQVRTNCRKDNKY
jgi:hypothetical protein